MRVLVSIFLSVILLAGCAVPASRWRDDAFSRFNSALAAGSQQLAPEETENIRQMLLLADRYYARELRDDAERLYYLSRQSSQLLYRYLMLSNVHKGVTVEVDNDITKQAEEITLSIDPVSISAVLKQAGPDREACATGRIDIDCDEGAEIESVYGTRTSHSPAAVDVVAPKPVITLASAATPQSGPAPATDRNPLESKQFPVPNGDDYASSSGGLKVKKTGRAVRVKRNRSARATIYLTFDDGPSRLTLPIAAYLNSQGIAATFFALGANVKGHEKTVRETVAMGHRVGNHTLSHNLRKLNGSLNHDVNEIERTASMLNALGGDGKMVRIPYGAATKTLAVTVAASGGEIFDWDIDSFDSTRRGAHDHAFIERAVLRQLQKSDKHHIIMLFHDGSGHEATLTAIRALIPRLKEEGYRFGLLSRSDRVAQARGERSKMP